MISPPAILAALFLYLAILFVLASWAERRSAAGRSVVNNSVFYSLGLTVLYTSWSFYGGVGNAANTGISFLVLFLGTVMPLFFWWHVVHKMVRIKNAYNITSIADFISARYDKSGALAGLVTAFSMVGVMPYIGLQLKAIISTYGILRIPRTEGIVGLIDQNAGIIITFLMIGFTVIFGVRRLDPTERHPGMVMAIAVEGFLKLLAFLLVGLFVTYYMYDGIDDIFSKMRDTLVISHLDVKRNDLSTISTWISLMVLAMFALMFLPRQFHMTVVENSQEAHIRTAMWFLPLYQILLIFLIFPVAIGGLLWGLPADKADTFVLRLPIEYGHHWMAIVVFIAGVAASSGMIMICAMTMSTMLTNHLLLPIVEHVTSLGFLKRHLLRCRWVCVACAILSGYLFERTMGSSHMLVSMGLISFAAAAQFAPPLLGGIFWRKGNKVGALLGLSLGCLVWFYTMILPSLTKSGWISDEIVTFGPLGFAFLKPEQLFGITGVSPIANTVFWSLALNVLGYVSGSVLFQQSKEESELAQDFVSILNPRPGLSVLVHQGSCVNLVEKRTKFEQVLKQYYTPFAAQTKLDECVRSLGLETETETSVIKFSELYSRVERSLAGVVGAAAAHSALKRGKLFSAQETEYLSAEYADILAELKIPPAELIRRIDYHRERERLLARHTEDLEQEILQREQEIILRRSVEERLRKAEEKYRKIFENAPEGIFQITLEGRFVSVNVAMSQMLGYETPEELIADVTDIKRQIYAVPEDHDPWLRSVIESNSVSSFEGEFFRKDHTKMWARVCARPLFHDDGSVIMIEGTFEDITARKKAEEERARLEEQLRHAQKMEAVGRLAGGIAHDFNNLLQAILGYANLLIIKRGPGDPDRHELEIIEQTVRDGADLVARILTFSRNAETKARPIDLNEEIRKAYRLVRRTIPRMVEIKLLLSDNLRIIDADPVQVEQLLLNLAVNAHHAMPEGGQILIETSNVALSDDYLRTHLRVEPGHYVLLTFSDTGVGMPPDVLERIFDPFFTTKTNGEGTGLGLSMVHGIVSQYRGHIRCYSEPGRGASFKIYFPASDKESICDVAITRGMPAFGTETILMVDDDDRIREMGRQMIEMGGYKVLLARSGEEALQVYSSHKDGISLVILDLIMPGMGGNRCLEELLRMDPEVKVLIASGYSSNGLTHADKGRGARGFVSKPYDSKDILAAIRRVLDRGHL